MSFKKNLVVIMTTFGVICFSDSQLWTPTHVSTWNNNDANLAVDGDPLTCALTGYQYGPWLKLDAGSVIPVSVVQITGATPPFNIRVGNESDLYGIQGGFSNNLLCASVADIDTGTNTLSDVMVTYGCGSAIYGRYISIQGVDNANPVQMRVCEVQVFGT